MSCHSVKYTISSKKRSKIPKPEPSQPAPKKWFIPTPRQFTHQLWNHFCISPLFSKSKAFHCAGPKARLKEQCLRSGVYEQTAGLYFLCVCSKRGFSPRSRATWRTPHRASPHSAGGIYFSPCFPSVTPTPSILPGLQSTYLSFSFFFPFLSFLVFKAQLCNSTQCFISKQVVIQSSRCPTPSPLHRSLR